MACSALNCNNRWFKKSGRQFFRFPLGDRDRLDKWMTNMERQNWTPKAGDRLCSDHFQPHMLTTDLRGRTCLKDTAVPTVFLRVHEETLEPATSHPDVQSDDAALMVAVCVNVDTDITIQSEDVDDIQTASDHCYSSTKKKKASGIRSDYVDHDYIVSDSPTSLKRKCSALHEKLCAARKKLKFRTAQGRKWRCAASSLKDTVKTLEEQLHFANESPSILKDFGEVPREIFQIIIKKKRAVFSENLKQFASKLHGYSPKAYDYVRGHFQLALPHSQTIRKQHNNKINLGDDESCQRSQPAFPGLDCVTAE